MALTAELRSPVVTASGQICANEGAYVGYLVTVVTAVGVINVRDGSVTGPIIDTLPIGTAAGAKVNLATPIRFKTTLHVEFAGGATGSVTFFYN